MVVLSVCPGGSADQTCFADGARTITFTSPYLGDSQLIYGEICEDPSEHIAKVSGSSTGVVCRAAVARKRQILTASPAILAIDPSACGAINTHGNGDITASGGSVQVNSKFATALTQEGSGSELISYSDIISDECICVTGGAEFEHPGKAQPELNTGAPPVPDP
jgi:hypothetical protein